MICSPLLKIDIFEYKYKYNTPLNVDHMPTLHMDSGSAFFADDCITVYVYITNQQRMSLVGEFIVYLNYQSLIKVEE